MGTEYVFLNRTRREFFSPRDVGDGYKAIELLAGGSPVALAYLLMDLGTASHLDASGMPPEIYGIPKARRMCGRWAGGQVEIQPEYSQIFSKRGGIRLRDQGRTKANYTNISTALMHEWSIFRSVEDWAPALDDALDRREDEIEPGERQLAPLVQRVSIATRVRPSSNSSARRSKGFFDWILGS